jgi:hypothetical protein
MTKREMAEEIVNILEELGIIKVADMPEVLPSLPENHCDLSCISETEQTLKVPLSRSR